MEYKSKGDVIIIEAFNKGYQVVDGVVFYRGKKVSIHKTSIGYCCFYVKNSENKTRQIKLHRFVAYQKYGNSLFKKGIEVRHLDSNKCNNTDINIVLGTRSENCMDKSKETRIRCGRNSKKHNHNAIIELHRKGASYGKIMKQLNIKSKGTISFIIKKSIESAITK